MARPILPRLDLRVLKNKSAGDPAQVPTASTVNGYRQGATVIDAITLPPFTADHPVNVYDVGRLVTNDSVRVNTGPATLLISGIESPTQVLLTNFSSSSVTVPAGARLVPTGNRPQFYAGSRGTAPLGTSFATDATMGRGGAHLSQDRVDYDIVIPGHPTRLYLDASGIYGRSNRKVSDARDYGEDVQAAIDALPAEGGVVLVSEGIKAQTAGILIQKPNVTLAGEGIGTYLRPAVVNAFDLITVEAPNFHLIDLTLVGDAYFNFPNGTKSCLVIRGPGFSGSSVAGLRLNNVLIQAAPKYGLWLRDATDVLAQDSQFLFNNDSGVRIESGSGGAATTRFLGCVASQNVNRGIEANGVTCLLLLGSNFEGNRGGYGASEGNCVDAENCVGLAIRSCYFEDANTTPRTHQFVALRSCPSAVVEGSWFQGGFLAPSEPLRPRQAVLFSNSPGARISSCSAQAMKDFFAFIDATSPDCIEFGNLEFGGAPGLITRLQIYGQRFISLSRRAVGVPTHAGETTFPSGNNVTPGSIAWAEALLPGHHHQLQVWDGNAWRGVELS
ncbi:MAG: right-handed parallel beta-helix repeat-containing protein [Candidatus Eisenbacteria bacterium]